MRAAIAIPLTVALSVAAGIAGYLLGASTEATMGRLRDEGAEAAALLALEPGLSSTDPNEREHALWLKLGVLRAQERKANQLMPGDLAAMQVALTYATLAQLHPPGDPAAGRSELLMKHAVSACGKTASPNCNAEALSSMARRLGNPASGPR